MAQVERDVSQREITGATHLRALNHEIVPVLRAVRRVLNAALKLVEDFASDAWGKGEHLVVPFGLSGGRPAAGTSASYQTIDSFSTSSFATTTDFDPEDYESELYGLERTVYVRLAGRMGSPGAADDVRFRLYNVTDGEAVDDVELVATSTRITGGIFGPLTVGTSSGNVKSSTKTYAVQGLRTGGTTEEAFCVLAEWVIRYE